jgi:protease PrsW
MSGAPATAARRRSFVDPASPAFWTMTVLIVIGAIVLWQLEREPFLFAGSFVPVAAIVWLLYGLLGVGLVVWLQRYGRRPWLSVLGALAWGGLAAVAFATVGNTALATLLTKVAGISTDQAIVTAIQAPLVEETLKTIGIIGLAAIPGVRLRGPLDGIFYGVLVGMGFQVMEDFSLTVTQGGFDASALVNFVELFVVRGFIAGIFSHAVWTGIVGASIGYAKARTDRSMFLRVGAVLGAMLFVMILHGLADLTDDFFAKAAISLVSIGALIVLIIRARRIEARRLAGLADVAVERGLMTTEEQAALSGDQRPADKGARRRQTAQLRYLEAVDEAGPDGPLATTAAAKIGPAV